MVARRASALLTAAFPVLAAIVALATPAAAADPVELRIEVYGFAGFHVLTNRTSVAASGDRYSIATDLDTRGLASVFVDLTSHSEVRGRLMKDGVRPAG